VGVTNKDGGVLRASSFVGVTNKDDGVLRDDGCPQKPAADEWE
jgi:hypothetical protein